MIPQVVTLARPDDVAGWRHCARSLLRAGVAPEQALWQVAGGAGSLFDAPAEDATPPLSQAPAVEVERASADHSTVAAPTVPRRFLDLCDLALRHSDPERFALAYRLLWRLQVDRALLQVPSDGDVARLEHLARAVRRDMHKMRAFVRFRHVPSDPGGAGAAGAGPGSAGPGGADPPSGGAGERYVAWFEPDHHIVEANAPFFARRFADMHWSILTPRASAHWDGQQLMIGPGAERGDAPDRDPAEAAWRLYYRSIFNPARLKTQAMLREMPRKYWANLPEAEDIAPLTLAAASRTQAMLEAAPVLRPARATAAARAVAPNISAEGGPAPAAQPPVPAGGPQTPAPAPDLGALSTQAQGCRRCDLWRPATQTVFGAGNPAARLVLVGEQPGDQEDLAGTPFVGPAGQMLDRALEAAGVDRSQLWVTNAVKHFKFTARGKRRIHARPDASEITACRWWLDQELALLSPALAVGLGVTALSSLLQRSTVTISRVRGQILDGVGGVPVLATIHPSYLLRLPDAAARQAEYERFVQDLALAARHVAQAGPGQTGAPMSPRTVT